MTLSNLEKLKLGNYWFSRAGRYDRQKGGTFGDERSIALLRALQLPFQAQVSAGYANFGHSNNKGGEHAQGAIDFGFSSLNRKQQQALINRVKELGYDYIHEDPGGPNDHLHVRTGGASQPAQLAAPNIPVSNFTPPQVVNLPELPQVDISQYSNLDLAGVNPDGTPNNKYAEFDKLIQQHYAQGQQQVADYQKQTAANDANTYSQLDKIIQDAQAVQSVKLPTNPLSDAANSVIEGIKQDQLAKQDIQASDLTQGMQGGVDSIKPRSFLNDIGDAIATEAQTRFSPQGALDVFNTGLNAVAQLSPVGMPVGRIQADANPSLTAQAAGGGVLQLGANIGNFGSGIAQSTGDLVTGKGWTNKGFDTFQVPQQLKSAMSQLPVTEFAFENAPLAVLPTGNLLGAGKPIANLALDTLLQAGLGVVGTQGDLGQRLINGGLAGVVNLGAAGVGKLARNILKPATKLDDVSRLTPEQLKAQFPEATQVNDLTGSLVNEPVNLAPYLSELPQPKQAFESAQVFKSQVDDITTAKQLANDTALKRQAIESDLQSRYGVNDPIEAQRLLGKDIIDAQNAYNRFGESQYLDNLNQKQSTLDSLLNARTQELQAARLLDELDPKGLYRNARQLPEITPSKPLIDPSVNQIRPASDLVPNQIVNAQQLTPNANQLVNNTQPNGVSQVVNQTPNQPEFFNQGLVPDVQKAIGSLTNGGDKVALSIQDALTHIDNKLKAGLFTPEQAQLQKDIVAQFVEAGRRGTTFDMAHRELKEGLGAASDALGKAAVKTRTDLAPFALTNRTIKPSTEVNNLVKSLGSAEAARDNLIQRVQKYGITPTSAGRTTRAQAVNLAQQLYDHPQGKLELTHTYLENHNFKSGGEGTTRGYRLDTVEQAGMGTKQATIPESIQYQNAIKAQYDSLQTLANTPNLPDSLKKPVEKILKKPAPSVQDVKSLRKALSNFEDLRQFCNLFGFD